MTEQALWPADAVERRAADSLIPYARNARTHSEEQVAQIAASIREWGFTNPVLVDEDSTIIAGHGRVLAAQKLGLPEVPVMVARGWTEAQRRAYVLADNKLALNAGWDVELLRVEFADLGDLGVDLELTGFSLAEVETFDGWSSDLERVENTGENLDGIEATVKLRCPADREDELREEIARALDRSNLTDVVTVL